MANELPDTQGATQTQTQQSLLESQLISQPLENPVWGRLHGRHLHTRTLDLCNEVFTAGRSDENDLCIVREQVSSRNILDKTSKLHFTIKKDISDLSSPAYITDESRNGTFVNGLLLGKGNRMILKHKDVISITSPHHQSLIFFEIIRTAADELQGLPEEISSRYYISRKLGSGACGTVFMVYDVMTCGSYAMKQIRKNELAESGRPQVFLDPARVMNEVEIMKKLSHPCVVRMHDVVDRKNALYIFLECMRGGELLTRITDSEEKHLSERTSKLFFLQLLHAVKYLHSNKITHRDLKPDNILLADDAEETLLKISDFGMSKLVKKDSVMRTVCGTPVYVAPEILKTNGQGSYTPMVDIWSLGVVLFTMLSGTLPFSNDYGSSAAEQIKRAQFGFRHHTWREVSTPAKKLILEILTVDPNQRPSIEQIFASTWMRDEVVVRKAEKLMGIKLSKSSNKQSTSDIENNNRTFAEPPKKKQRTK